jgi:hypothetical protein
VDSGDGAGSFLHWCSEDLSAKGKDRKDCDAGELHFDFCLWWTTLVDLRIKMKIDEAEEGERQIANPTDVKEWLLRTELNKRKIF